MKRPTKTIWLTLVIMMALCGAAAGAPVPDTGQTKCYDNTGEIPCPQAGEPFYGQDGNYLINPPSYTKLDANGNELPDDATEWVMVRDNVTGLIWEVKRNKDGVQDYSNPHDADNTYTWYDSNPATNGGDAGVAGDGTDTEDFINALNAENFGGFSDWRLPTAKELAYLTWHEGVSPKIATAYFPQTQSNSYWSQTAYAGDNTQALKIYFSNAINLYENKANMRYLRAVRGKKKTATLHDNGDGTVTDRITGLMWGQQPDNNPRTWQQALSLAAGLRLGGHDDWRLPNYKEMISIFDFSMSHPCLDTNFFPGFPSSINLWTSTTFEGLSAWKFRSNDAGTGFSIKTNGDDYIWFVRGGQPVLDGHIYVTAPRMADYWGIGKQVNITWDPAGVSGNVRILLSREGGKPGTFETIVESTENDGSYSWTPTGPESYNCVLRVEPIDNPELGNQVGMFSIMEIKPETITADYQVAVIGTASQQMQLHAWALDGTYDLTSEVTSWSSSELSVATVDATGMVTALKAGKTTIQATYGDSRASMELEVIGGTAREVEPNENGTSATQLAESAWALGEISSGSDVDTFVIDLPESQWIRLEMLLNIPGKSAQVKVQDQQGGVISEFTLGSSGWNKRTLDLPQGDAMVAVTAPSACEYLVRYVFLSNKQGGSKIWEFQTGFAIYSSPAVSAGRVYVGSVDHKLHCLDAETGGKIWEFQAGSNIDSSPAVSSGKVYVGSGDGKLYCLDAETGGKIWEFQTGSTIESSPAVSSAKVYVGSGDGKLYCLDAETGGKIWEFQTGAWIYRSPAVSSGKVYVGGGDSKLYCLDAETGGKIWEFDTGGGINSSSAVSSGKVYVGSGDHIYCLDAETGGKIWEFQAGGGINSSPAVSSGKVYVGSSDNKLYCLDAGDPNAGGWTMLHHDLQHTGDAAHTRIGIPEYEVLANPIEEMEQYRLYLVAEYEDGNHDISVSWTSSDQTVGLISGSTLTALANGRVVVSCTHEGTTYKKTLYLQPNPEDFEWLYNDTRDTAMPITAGRFVEAELLENDVDFYSFTLAADSLVEIAYLSYSKRADTRVQILDGTGAVMAEGISTDGQELIFPLGLAAGSYYVKIEGAGDIDQDSFYAISHVVLGDLAPKDVAPIAMGQSVQSAIYHLEDASSFTFSLPEEQGVRIRFEPTSETARYRVELIDDSQEVIDRNDCLFGEPIFLEAIYPASDYVVRVTPLGEVDAASPFTLGLEASTRLLEREINDQYQEATSFEADEAITGRLSSPEDVDFYTFTIEAPRYLDLAFSCEGSRKDFSIRLYKESDQNLIDGVDTILGRDAVLPMGLTVGRYYLKVAAKNQDNPEVTRYYTLSLGPPQQTNLEIESNNTIKFANAIGKDSPLKGRVFSGEDVDYYGFYLPEAGFFTISFTPESLSAEYRVSMVDANDEVVYTKTSTDGQAVLLNVNPFPGNYFVRVEANGDIDQYSFYELALSTEVEGFEIIGLKSLVSVTVSGDKNEINAGDTLALTATANYSDATSEVIASPIWESLDSGVATVSAAGVVSGVGVGTTTIVATYGGVTGKFDVTVGAPAVVYEQHYGNLVLVAGGGVETTNTLKESTQYLSDLVYGRFRGRLFRDEDIYYLNPMTWHDVNGDGYDDNIVDDPSPTVADLGVAITEWAAAQSTDGPLYVCLIDHGGIDKFEVFPGETLTAAQLRGFLDSFQENTGRRVVVLIEACKSGSFTDDLVTGQYDRMVITSTDNLNAYLDLEGRISFTQFLMDRLYAGDSFRGGFLKAVDRLANMGLPYSQMAPQLAEVPANLAANLYVGGSFAIAGLEPVITETSPNQSVTANQAHAFYAVLADLEDISRVWAVVVPPGYTPPEVAQDLESPEVDLPTFELAYNEVTGRYEGTYDGFVYNDIYRITFYASNTNGSVTASPPIEITVTGGMGLDSDGDGMPNDWESQYPGLDSNVDDGSLDPDGDKLTNLQEYHHDTSPIAKDSDGDGMDDGWEVSWGFIPNQDDAGLDADSDGVSNLVEYQDGTNPIDANSYLDHVLPRVISTVPAAGEVHVRRDATIQVSFNEAMDTQSMSINQISIFGEASGTHLGDIHYEAINKRLTVVPEFGFDYGERVEVTLSCELTDTAGNPLDGNQNGQADSSPADDYSWAFVVEESPEISPPNPYDANGDWMIGDFELLDAIDAWANGDMIGVIDAACDVDFYLLDLIDLWKADTYSYEQGSDDTCFPWKTD